MIRSGPRWRRLSLPLSVAALKVSAGEVTMRKRIALLIGPVLALLLVLVALAIPWRASKSAPAAHPRPPSATAVATAPPAVGADGIGDPYFPRAGNGGYDITAYDIAVRYDPPTDRLEGHTTITATATESLSRFN